MKKYIHKTLALTLSVSLLAAYTPGFATERVVVPVNETDTISEDLTGFNNPALTGGAAQNSGILNVDDGVSFENNTAHAGGAIYSTGTELNIGNNVSFTGNSTAEGQDAGAALYAMGDATATNVVIGDNVKFTQNTSNQKAGAIFLEDANLTIGDNAEFKNNSSVANAGAIYNWDYLAGNSKTIIGKNAVFEGNTAGTNGGAIANYDGNVTLGSGAKFISNTAQDNGGAIYNIVYDENKTATMSMQDATFTNNTAAGYGGAVYNSGTFTVADATFTGNKTTTRQGENISYNIPGWTKGGAVYNTGTFTLSGTNTFENNQSAMFGGAIGNEGGTVSITTGETKFNGNKTGASTSGGAITNFSGGTVNISDDAVVSFENNVATSFGGAIYQLGEKLQDGTVYYDNTYLNIGSNTTFKNNTARTGGAIAYEGSGTININGATFNDNTASNYGGAIAGVGSTISVVDIKNSTFKGNSAAQGGGAIDAYAQAISISGSDFTGNKVTNGTTYGGGAILVESATTIADSTFTENVSNVMGGAIHNTVTATVSNSTFTNNTAANQGGAIYNGGTLTLAGTNTFSGNTAAAENGGNDIYNTGILNINGTTTMDGGIAGTGTVNVDGTLNIGQAQVAANTITFAENSTLGVEFGNASEGMGNLNASTVEIGNGSNLVVTLSKDFLTTDTTTHDLINSDATVTGAFTLADVGNALYNVSLNEDNQVIAQRKSQEEQSEAVQEAGGTGNDVAVLAAYTASSDLGGETANKVADIINTLAQTDTAAAVAATKAIAPEVAPAKQVVHTAVLNEVFGALQNRMAAATTAAPATYALGDSKNYRSANAKNFSVWTQGLLNKSHKEATDNAGAFTGRSTGIAAGADMKPTDNTLVGAGYAYTHTNVSSTGRHDRILGDTFFLYGQYRPSAFYVQGSVAYGDSKYEESKYLPGLKLGADYHVQSYSAQALAGYDVTDWFSPNFGLRYTRLHQDGYNDGAQDVSGDNLDYFTAMLGTDLQTQLRVARHISLLPHMHAGLSYDFVSADNDSRVALPNGSGYMVSGERLDRLSVELGAGFTARLYQSVEISAAYEGSFREDYNSHTGTLKLRYLF